MREGTSVIDYVTEFNSLLLLSLLPSSWSGILTVIANTFETTKLTFEGIRD